MKVQGTTSVTISYHSLLFFRQTKQWYLVTKNKRMAK